MRTIKINDRFESLGRFQIRHRVAFLVVLAVFTIIGCLGLPRLKLAIWEITVKAWNGPIKRFVRPAYMTFSFVSIPADGMRCSTKSTKKPSTRIFSPG